MSKTLVACNHCGGEIEFERCVVDALSTAISLRWLVFCVGSTVDEPVAAFQFSDMAREWAEKNYKGRYALREAM